MTTGACSSCGAPIIWVKSPAGANLPLDGSPVLDSDDERVNERSILYRIDGADAKRVTLPVALGPLYLSHFATCPNAAQHSRRRSG